MCVSACVRAHNSQSKRIIAFIEKGRVIVHIYKESFFASRAKVTILGRHCLELAWDKFLSSECFVCLPLIILFPYSVSPYHSLSL